MIIESFDDILIQFGLSIPSLQSINYWAIELVDIWYTDILSFRVKVSSNDLSKESYYSKGPPVFHFCFLSIELEHDILIYTKDVSIY
jgi:hypothetical protein